MADTQQIAVVDDSAYDTMALMPKNMQQAKDFADQLSKSSLIPKHLQNKPGDCLMITMQAFRWRMDPFVIANCTSVVHGRLMYEGKLVYAALKSMNAIEGRLDFKYEGQGKDLQITITGTPRGAKEPASITGTWAGWRQITRDKETGAVIPNNWDKDPMSQITYRGIRQWARLFTPEAILGVYTPDDNFDDDAPITVQAEVVAKPVPETKPTATDKPAPASKSQAKRQAAQQAAPAAAQAAPAAQAATTDADPPFDDPAASGEAEGGGEEAAEEGGVDETASTTAPGDALTETMGRIVKSARENTKGKVTPAGLDAKFPLGVGKGNINEALTWLRSQA